MSTMMVNTDVMRGLQGDMLNLAGQAGGVAESLADLGWRTSLFLGLGMNQAGVGARELLGGSLAETRDLQEDLVRLSQILEVTAANYEELEQATAEMLCRCDTGASALWGADAYSWSASGSAGAGGGQSRPGAPSLLDGLSFKLVFGAAIFLDLLRAKDNPLRRRSLFERTMNLLRKLHPVFWFSGPSSDAQKWLYGTFLGGVNKIAKVFGINRGLAHAERITDQEIVRQAQDGLVVATSPTDVMGNLLLAGQIDDRVEELMGAQGREGRYQTVMVQVLINERGEKIYMVYIPGTDFESGLLSGDPAQPLANLDEWDNEPHRPLSAASASAQLVDEALRKAGAPDGARIYVTGFSKGGVTANSYAHTLEARRFRTRGIYSFGSPDGRAPTEVPGAVSREYDAINDQVPLAGGYDPTRRQGVMKRKFLIEDVDQVHGSQQYYDAMAQDPSLNVPVPELALDLAGARPVGEPVLVAGTTEPTPPASVQAEGKREVSLGESLYHLVDTAQEVLPHSISVEGIDVYHTGLPQIPDVPDYDALPGGWDEEGPAYSLTLGDEDLPHLELEIDGGRWNLDIKLFPEADDGGVVRPGHPGYDRPVTLPQGDFAEGADAGVQLWESREPVGAGGNF